MIWSEFTAEKSVKLFGNANRKIWLGNRTNSGQLNRECRRSDRKFGPKPNGPASTAEARAIDGDAFLPPAPAPTRFEEGRASRGWSRVARAPPRVRGSS
jgi:hypothetical protein